MATYLDGMFWIQNGTSGPFVAFTITNAIMPSLLNSLLSWAYGEVVSMFDFHRSDRGSNPGRGGKIS